MNENATDENTPTGKALGNIAIVGLSAAAILGLGVGATKAVGGAKNWAKKNGVKRAEKSAKRATAKDIKNRAADISKNHGSEFTSGEVNNLAEQSNMISNYTKQANPNLSEVGVDRLQNLKNGQNIENYKHLRNLKTEDIVKDKPIEAVDATANFDDIFDNIHDGPEPTASFGAETPKPTNRTDFYMDHNPDAKGLKAVQDGFDGFDMPTKVNDYSVDGKELKSNLDEVSLEDFRNSKKSPEEQNRIKQEAEDAISLKDYNDRYDYLEKNIDNVKAYNTVDPTGKNLSKDIKKRMNPNDEPDFDYSSPRIKKAPEDMTDIRDQASMFDPGYNKVAPEPVSQIDGQTSMFDPGLPREQEAELARMQKEKGPKGIPVGNKEMPSILPDGQAKAIEDINAPRPEPQPKVVGYGTGNDYSTQDHKTDSRSFFNTSPSASSTAKEVRNAWDAKQEWRDANMNTTPFRPEPIIQQPAGQAEVDKMYQDRQAWANANRDRKPSTEYLNRNK